MIKNKNTYTFVAIFVILVLMVVGVYFYYFAGPNGGKNNGPVSCQGEDVFDIFTGEICPGKNPLQG